MSEGMKVRLRRVAGNQSQAALAKKIGISQRTISKIELGQFFPNKKLRKRIARALQVEEGELFSGD